MTKRSWLTLSLALVLAAPALPVRGAEPAEAPRPTHVGTQTVRGVLEIPVLGEVDTRVTFTVLARLEQEGEALTISQRACRVEFSNVLGIGTEMADAGVQRLPEERIVFRAPEKDWMMAEPWLVGWGAEDIDADGHPGATVKVKAPLCGGEVRVGSETLSVARGQWSGEAFEGQVRVRVTQQILGASNRCLEATASDRREKMSGTFTYRPVPETATCESVLDESRLAALQEAP